MDTGIFEDLLDALSEFSLIQRARKAKSIKIHRLVQAVLRDGLNQKEMTVWRRRALSLCEKAFPWVHERNVVVQRRFRSQIMPCILDPELEESDMAARMFARVAWYLDCEAQYQESVQLWERAVTVYRNVNGEDKKLLDYIMWLGGTYAQQGRLRKAIEFRQKALDGFKRLLGDEHERTTSAQRNLGATLMKQGSIPEGVALIEQAVFMQRKKLGNGITELQQKMLEDSMKKLAVGYMYTSRLTEFGSVQCELGWAYCQVGRATEGAKLLEEAYSSQVKAFGENHRVTMISTRYLACAYLQQSRIAEGLELLDKTWKLQEKLMGPEHEDTLLTVNYVARAYQEHGREEGGALLRQGLIKLGWKDVPIFGW
jgi:tetratricopeptide (TPR) repeat protein